MFVGWQLYNMAMIGHLIRIISCAAAVVIRTDYVIIIPDITRGEHSAFVFMPSCLPGGQFLPGEFAGFATDFNLHSGQVSLLDSDIIAAAALPDVRTVSLADADRFVFAGVYPLRPRPALIGIEVLVKKAGGAWGLSSSHASRTAVLTASVIACCMLISSSLRILSA